jgi:hypothetical protein
MLFWRTSPKKDERGRKNGASPKPHSFHVNPSKSWGYYNSASQAELYDLVKVRKSDTATTAESAAWSYTLERLAKEQDDDAMSVESEEGQGIFFTPEGITRVPFTQWGVDLPGTARLSSYYQSETYQSTGDPLLKARAATAFKTAAHNNSTPHNSPRRFPFG